MAPDKTPFLLPLGLVPRLVNAKLVSVLPLNHLPAFDIIQG